MRYLHLDMTCLETCTEVEVAARDIIYPSDLRVLDQTTGSYSVYLHAFASHAL